MFGIIGLPVPDETLLTFAGFLVYQGKISLLPAFLAAYLGSSCGITISYVVGRTLGLGVVHRYGSRFHLTEGKVERARSWFHRIGKWALLFGYYLPGIRHLTAFAAGTSKLKWPEFAAFTYTGGFLWTVTFLSLGYFLGREWARTSERLHHYLLVGSALVIVLFLVSLYVQRRRRRLQL